MQIEKKYRHKLNMIASSVFPLKITLSLKKINKYVVELFNQLSHLLNFGENMR